MSDLLLRGFSIQRRKIGKNKGKPRVWLQGADVSQSGIQPGDAYEISIREHSFVIRKASDGNRTVTLKKKSPSDSQGIPVIDINSEELLAIFDGFDAVAVHNFENEIHIRPLDTDLKLARRKARIENKLRSGEPLSIGSVSHGVGILTEAVHRGMDKAGVPTKLAFANEIRPELISLR